jgi:hypothetical protein
MPKEDLPKFLRNGKYQMTMGHIDELIYCPLHPFVGIPLSTGCAEASLTGKRTLLLTSTMHADIFSLAVGRFPTGKHLLYGFYNGFPVRRFVSPG